MKKYLVRLTVLFLLLNSFQTMAQKDGSLWLQPVLGFNSNWIINQNAYQNPELDYATSFGLTGGLGVNYFCNEKWAFNGSVLISKLGQNYKGMQNDGDATRKVKFMYVEIPLVMKRRISDNENTTWLTFGPDFMILTSAKQDYERKGGLPLTNGKNLETGDIRDRILPFDMDLNLGIEKIYKLRDTDNTMLSFAFNSAVGLTDINQKDWRLPNLKGVYKGSHNFYFGFKVGLLFNMKKHWLK